MSGHMGNVRVTTKNHELVNIDEEMLKLTENNIKYNVAVQLLSKKMRQIQTAISQSK